MASRRFAADLGFRVVMDADLANSTTTLATLTDLVLNLRATRLYRFRFVIPYTAAATTTGSRWVLAGTAAFSELSAVVQQTLTATTLTTNYVSAFNAPAGANATSLLTGNLAVIEGVLRCTTAGTLRVDFASEVGASAITARRGAWVELTELYRE